MECVIERMQENLDDDTFVRELVKKYGKDRSMLIPMLQEVMLRYHYLPREVLETLSEKIEVPISEIINVATFYHQFRLEPVGRYIVSICFGTACYLLGSAIVYEAMRDAMGLKGDKHTTDDLTITVEPARCFGCCSLAPVAMVTSADGKERYVHGKLTPSEGRKLVRRYRAQALKERKEE